MNMSSHYPPSLRNQAGLALFVALIVLVAMSIAGVALIRSVDTGTLIARNLAFQQSATLSGDQGVETARTWLLSNSSSLTADRPGNGYYATSQDMLDLTGNVTPNDTSDNVNWDGKGGTATPSCQAKDSVGNTVCYVIHRLCDTTGPLDSSTCSTRQYIRTDSGKGGVKPQLTNQPGSWDPEIAAMGVYRVTIRVSGTRNNISYLQAFIVI